ncbi:hypothetical protein [Sporisorium scitamineum]|uniref:Uncharacterized protein n=1 Tax=Sporisorium scitamineum TaxID=49012 RepID=A0A0F7RYB2_9BASI|nr:hypothetical protein [Sporisorium scitamineum]
MPISPSTSISDPTSLRQPDDLPIPVAASLETSADATACHNTFSHEKAFDSPPAIRRGRRSFQRLPISKLAASLKDAEASEFEFENDQDVEATREGEENLPQSPGDSPVSRFSPYQEERSPTATLFTRLVFGFQSHKRSRNRSGSVGSGKRLHASPPPASPAPRGLALEPEDFIVPKRKVAKRKPIPTSLFSSVSGERDKQCSVSVPDVFSDFNSHVYDEEEGSHKIDARNSLGLFLPTIELQQQQPHASTSGTLTDPNLDQVSDTQAWASQHRLRRSTRSISESHSRRRVTSLGASRVSSTTSTSTQITFARRTVDFAGLSDSTSSDSSSGDDREHTTKRGRTRGGSEPVYPCSFERFSIDDSRPLRRVSRKRTGEMRSVYLSDPSTDSLLRRLQPLLMQNVKGGEEGEAIEVLKTPDETSQATFGNLARISMSFSSPSKGGSLGSVDSGFSRRGSGGSENWGGLGSSSGDGLSTASMAVLQQQIQMQNWQRMVGADSGGAA